MSYRIVISLIILILFTPLTAFAQTDDSLTQNPPRHFAIPSHIYSNTTPAQLDFINTHYDYILTSVNKQRVRNAVKGPKLFLYRSIQGTWTNFTSFDWNHINSHENMFCHNNNQRIKTIWNSWLMDPADFVDPSDADAMDHWINYYAVTASQQVRKYNYDGLFIDSASHRITPGVLYRKMPDNYNSTQWRNARAKSLEFIKSHLPDKLVIYNGLHSQNRADESLKYTDGGLWEIFAYKSESGTYQGFDKWLAVIELAEKYKHDKYIVITSKKPDLTNDIQARTFITASVLLIAHQNIVFSMIDFDYDKTTQTYLYYPEYDINLGTPLGTYHKTEEGLFIRSFTQGQTIVNPHPTKSLTYTLSKPYTIQLIPKGGGPLPKSAITTGSLIRQPITTKTIILPPVSAIILVGVKSI